MALLLDDFEEPKDEANGRTSLVNDLVNAVLSAFGHNDAATTVPVILMGSIVWGDVYELVKKSQDQETMIKEQTERFKNLSSEDYCRYLSGPDAHTLDSICNDTSLNKVECLFGHFLHKGNIGVLFGETNAGKSVLSYEIAMNFLHPDKSLEAEELGSDGSASKRMVLYYDLEMGKSQIHNRLKNMDSSKKNAMGSFVVKDGSTISNVDDLISSINEKVVKNYEILCVVDNLSILGGANGSSKPIREMITKLKALIKKYPNITILLISHTTKKRKFTSLQLDDLRGSKTLADLVDSVFALGNSLQDNLIKYVKHLKSRDYKIYNKVARFDLVGQEGNLHFEFVSWDEEDVHTIDLPLNSGKPVEDPELIAKVMDCYLRKCNETQIAKMLRLSISKVRYILDNNPTVYEDDVEVLENTNGENEPAKNDVPQEAPPTSATEESEPPQEGRIPTSDDEGDGWIDRLVPPEGYWEEKELDNPIGEN